MSRLVLCHHGRDANAVVVKGNPLAQWNNSVHRGIELLGGIAMADKPLTLVGTKPLVGDTDFGTQTLQGLSALLDRELRAADRERRARLARLEFEMDRERLARILGGNRSTVTAGRSPAGSDGNRTRHVSGDGNLYRDSCAVAGSSRGRRRRIAPAAQKRGESPGYCGA